LGRGRRREHWRAAAHGGEVAGLHQNGDSGLASERKLVRKRERGTLNRSRGLAQGHGTAEARCGGEVGRPTPVSHCARCRGKTKGNWAREGSLPWREGPGRRRGGRAAVLGQIHGSTAAWRQSAFVVRALQCSSGSCASRVNVGRCCGSSTGVREIRGSPVVRNRRRGALLQAEARRARRWGVAVVVAWRVGAQEAVGAN